MRVPGKAKDFLIRIPARSQGVDLVRILVLTLGCPVDVQFFFNARRFESGHAIYKVEELNFFLKVEAGDSP